MVKLNPKKLCCKCGDKVIALFKAKYYCKECYHKVKYDLDKRWR